MPNGPVIAILGGGQLGRMFIENALRYDVPVHVLDPDAQAPCSPIATRFVQGRFDEKATVLSFARDADVVGIEIEHVNIEALETLQAMGKRVIPDPSVLRIIQDKGRQKSFYRDHGIPTAPFTLIDGPDAITEHADMLPAFLKSRTGGYDGRGVMPIASTQDVERAFPGPSVLEKQAAIRMELAVLVVRDDAGNTVCYDPVEMVFDPRFNLVDHLRAPARIDKPTRDGAIELARTVANAFAAPGLYAVELFLTTDHQLWVNETAPRAHNSGHHTIEACMSSQFDQLLRLYLGMPLGDTTLRAHAAMINLVGEGGSGEPTLSGMHELLGMPATYPHLYGKRQTRTGRKMGHVTTLAPDDATLDRTIEKVKHYARVTPANTSTVARSNT